MRRFTRVIVAIVAVMVVSSFASASIVIKTSDGQGADAYAQGTATNTAPFPNTGSSSSLVVKNGAAPDQYTRKTYLRFDLAAWNGGSFAAARLDLRISNNDDQGTPTDFVVEVLGLVDGYAGVDQTPTPDGDVTDEEDVHDEFWAESTLDWDSAPANVTTSGFSLTSDAVSLGTFNVTANDTTADWVSFSSAALDNFIHADTNGVITLIVRRTGAHAGGSSNLSFYSKEASAASAPTLTLIPEPATLAMLAMGSLGLIRRR
ncbi:PEP-CTERM sorting domain-containing protein [Planctomycetales bacterium ZRK34]|nr:PEP-CTERM sorting domain-containing protein [Planctomycetales bacterium ZRK34]